MEERYELICVLQQITLVCVRRTDCGRIPMETERPERRLLKQLSKQEMIVGPRIVKVVRFNERNSYVL